jgi:AraC-like DNA-binding protein
MRKPAVARPTRLPGLALCERREVRVHSRDRDHARDMISCIFSDHTLEVVGPAGDLDVMVQGWNIGSITVADIRHGAEVIVRPGRLVSYYEVNMPVQGHTISTCGAKEIESGPGRAVVLTPTEASSMRWSADCAQVAVKVSRAAVERVLEGVLGGPPDEAVRFEVGFDLTTGTGKTWARSVALLRDALRQGAPDMMIRPLEEAVISGLLVAQSSNFSASLDGGPRPARPRMVARVQEQIESDPSAPLTVTDMARVARTSVRSLQAAFAEHLGMSPVAYQRRVRLARAHHDLEAAQPGDGQTVTDIALRWGFGHVPRFASAYRERYGVAPSQTLRA